MDAPTRSSDPVAARAAAEVARSRVARLVGPRRFEVVSAEAPDPGPGEVRVRILACGVCASELHTWEDTQTTYPVLIGHEPIGVIEVVGPGVESLSAGATVAGGFGPSFSDRVIVDHRKIVVVPEGLSTDDAIGEPLGCVIEARRRTPLTAGDQVAVVGVGYMGLLMLQVLMVTGAGDTVIVDPRPDARRTGLALGAAEAYAPEDVPSQDPDGTFDVVIEATGTQGGLDLATLLVRQHGVLSILGYHQGPRRSVDLQAWNWKAIDVVNAHVRRLDLLNDAIGRGLELVRMGRIHPGKLVTHRFGLDDIGEAFEALANKPEGFIKAVVVTS
jgi:threonine dehydrogenase-like Zn-dependent dehydrogenase